MLKRGDRVVHKNCKSVKGEVLRVVAIVRVDNLPHNMEYNIDNLIPESTDERSIHPIGQTQEKSQGT